MFNQTQDVAALIATYTNTARFNSRHCSPLAIHLQAAAPRDMTPVQREALALVVRRGAEVDEVRKARLRAAPPALRGPRNALATAWTAINNGLLAVGSTPADLGPEGPEAAQLAASLFPEGTAFAQADATSVWSHSKLLLERIADEGLQARVDALVHPVLLRAARRAHDQVGTVTGLGGRPTASAPTRALGEATARFAFAVSGYARALSVAIDETDHVAVARFAAALAPIDAMRIVGKADAEDEDPTDVLVDPVPTPIGPGPGEPTPPPFANA